MSPICFIDLQLPPSFTMLLPFLQDFHDHRAWPLQWSQTVLQYWPPSKDGQPVVMLDGGASPTHPTTNGKVQCLAPSHHGCFHYRVYLAPPSSPTILANATMFSSSSFSLHLSCWVTQGKESPFCCLLDGMNEGLHVTIPLHETDNVLVFLPPPFLPPIISPSTPESCPW